MEKPADAKQAAQPMVPMPANVKAQPYIPHKNLWGNIYNNIGRGHPNLVPKAPHGRTLIVVGGAPSVAKQYPEIAEKAKNPENDIIAINAMHDILFYEKELPVRYSLVVDPRPKHAKYVAKPYDGIEYWIASQCDQSVFKNLDGHNVKLWHCMNSGQEYAMLKAYSVNNKDEDFLLVRCGSTAGLAAITIGYSQGYRNFIVYGLDSSYTDDGKQHHAYQTSQVDENVVDVEVDGRKFKAVLWMIQQSKDFEEIFWALPDATITVRGDGMIPYVWTKCWLKKKKNWPLPLYLYQTGTRCNLPGVGDKLT